MDLKRLRYDCIVVGAGIAGIAAARPLVDAGFSVCLLEKSRGIGGRLATRRIEGECFDHGAQFMTAREEVFHQVVGEWISDGLARPWFGAPDRVRYCGVEGMNALAKALAQNLEVRREQKVEHLRFADGNWTVETASGSFECSKLLLTSPAPQALELLRLNNIAINSEVPNTLKLIEYDKCISLMLLLQTELGLSETGTLQREPEEPIATVTETSIKGTTSRPGIVIQSGPKFAEENFSASPESIFSQLTTALPDAGELKVESMSVQKWRFAKRRSHNHDISYVKDSALGFWHAGDGYVSPRIEGAFLSGRSAAESIIKSLQASA